jgi:hypothetical protein
MTSPSSRGQKPRLRLRSFGFWSSKAKAWSQCWAALPLPRLLSCSPISAPDPSSQSSRDCKDRDRLRRPSNALSICQNPTLGKLYSEEPTYTGALMRYTKIALLIFGFGLVLGLAVVAAEIKSLERVASGSMVLGIAAIPIGILADLRRAMMARSRAASWPARAPVRRVPPAARRRRKSAIRKR